MKEENENDTLFECAGCHGGIKRKECAKIFVQETNDWVWIPARHQCNPKRIDAMERGYKGAGVANESRTSFSKKPDDNYSFYYQLIFGWDR